MIDLNWLMQYRIIQDSTYGRLLAPFRIGFQFYIEFNMEKLDQVLKEEGNKFQLYIEFCIKTPVSKRFGDTPHRAMYQLTGS